MRRDAALPLVTRFQLADCLGADPVSIARWEREGLPVAERGRGGRASTYSLRAVIAWYVERERIRYRAEAGKLDPHQERARKDRAAAEMTELKIAEKRGRLVDKQAAMREWLVHIHVARDFLRSIPSKLKARRPDAERGLLALLGELIDEALQELADTGGDPDREAALAARATTATDEGGRHG